MSRERAFLTSFQVMLTLWPQDHTLRTAPDFMPLKEGRHDIEKTEGPPEKCSTLGLALHTPPPIVRALAKVSSEACGPIFRGWTHQLAWSSRWCVLFRLTQNHHMSSQEAPGHFGEQVRSRLGTSPIKPSFLRVYVVCPLLDKRSSKLIPSLILIMFLLLRLSIYTLSASVYYFSVMIHALPLILILSAPY